MLVIDNELLSFRLFFNNNYSSHARRAAPDSGRATPVSLNNIESIDVVRGGGAVRYGPQNVGGIINFRSRSIPEGEGISGDASNSGVRSGTWTRPQP
jgi:outer membrane receptor protein involved in Fe transport